jgi:hypothetical protein
MTPYELAKWVHQELSPLTPRLAAALNRALIEIGEGSQLVGLGPGTHSDDTLSIEESESIDLQGNAPFQVLAKIRDVITKVEESSTWKVIIDTQTSQGKSVLNLRYTLIRSKDTL